MAQRNFIQRALAKQAEDDSARQPDDLHGLPEDNPKRLMDKAFPSDPGHDPAARIRERVWYRNHLYYLGEHWLTYMKSTGKFGRLFEGDPTIPTPTSDFIEDTVNTLLALTMNKKFVSRIWPESNELADRNAAEIGQQLLQHMDAYRNYEVEDIKELIELTRILTGNAFARVLPVSDDQWIFDSGGNRVTKGEVRVEAVLPFNVALPDEGVLLQDKSWWAIQTLRTREWVEDMWQVKLPRGTDRDRGNINLQKKLLKMVADVSSWKGADIETELLDKVDEELVLLREMERRPTRAHPKGRYIAMAEGELLSDAEEMVIPCEDGWDYSLVHFPYRRQMGGFWSIDGVSKLISPQNIVNEIDQSLSINRNTFGRPFVITPAGLTLKRLSDRGSKILALEFDAATTHGVGPTISQGTPYPQQVLEERRQQIEVAQHASGDPKNVLSGQAPSGSASGIMVDILRETAEQSHVPDIMRFYRAWNKVDNLRLRLAQKVYTEKRKLKVKGEGNRIMVREFTSADLRNNTDVRFELDSGAASTNAGRNAFLVRLIESGFWENISQRPDLRAELLRRFGLSGFHEIENVHRKRATTENAILREGDTDLLRKVALPDPIQTDENGEPILNKDGEPKKYPWPYTFDPVFEHDPHEVHLLVHDEYMFSSEFRDLDPDQQARVIAHRDMHYQVLLSSMAEDIEAQMYAANIQGGQQPAPAPGGATGTPPPAPGGPSTPPAGTGGAPGAPAGTGSGAAGAAMGGGMGV